MWKRNNSKHHSATTPAITIGRRILTCAGPNRRSEGEGGGDEDQSEGAAAASPARTWPPKVSRTDVVTPQKGQGTPVSERIGQGSPTPAGRWARSEPSRQEDRGRFPKPPDVDLVRREGDHDPVASD